MLETRARCFFVIWYSRLACVCVWYVNLSAVPARASRHIPMQSRLCDYFSVVRVHWWHGQRAPTLLTKLINCPFRELSQCFWCVCMPIQMSRPKRIVAAHNRTRLHMKSALLMIVIYLSGPGGECVRLTFGVYSSFHSELLSFYYRPLLDDVTFLHSPRNFLPLWIRINCSHLRSPSAFHWLRFQSLGGTPVRDIFSSCLCLLLFGPWFGRHFEGSTLQVNKMCHVSL